jgi:predicted nucleic acid-binding protein
LLWSKKAWGNNAVAVITNTTLVSNFSAVGRLDLLNLCWGSLYIPEQVFAEIQDGRMQGYTFYDNIEREIAPLAPDGWLQLTSLQNTDEFRLFGELLGDLHHGEDACLAIATQRKWVFLSDDRAARQAAAKLNVSVSGTLGVLVSLLKRGIVKSEDGDLVLQAMVAKGYFSPVRSLTVLVEATPPGL